MRVTNLPRSQLCQHRIRVPLQTRSDWQSTCGTMHEQAFSRRMVVKVAGAASCHNGNGTNLDSLTFLRRKIERGPPILQHGWPPPFGFLAEKRLDPLWEISSVSVHCDGPKVDPIATGTRQERPAAREWRACFLPSFVRLSSRPHSSIAAAYISDRRHAARVARRVPNVPFQSSIRALMLLHAARRARSCRCGDPATKSLRSSRPMGP